VRSRDGDIIPFSVPHKKALHSETGRAIRFRKMEAGD